MFAAYTSPIEFIYPAPNSFEWGTIFGLRALPMWITVILFLTPFIFYFRNRNFKINLIYLQCFTAAFIYFIFQELALTRTNGQLICGGYYWGVIFAFFFNLLFAIWVTTNNHRFWRYTSIALALSICGFGSLNSVNSSKMTMRHNHNLYPNLANLKLGDYGDFDYKSLVEIWKHRKDHEKVRELLKGKPKNMAWIYYESRKHTLKPHRD